jgi:hypothetical protein
MLRHIDNYIDLNDQPFNYIPCDHHIHFYFLCHNLVCYDYLCVHYLHDNIHCDNKQSGNY